MAKTKGIFPLKGTLNGVNFYYLNGKPVARVAGGGFNSKAIKDKASMQRVRENGSEFGHCSRVNKAFRMALQAFYSNYTFTFFHSRLMTLFTSLKALDVENKRGERKVYEGINTQAGKDLLLNFAYTPACKPQEHIGGNYILDAVNGTLELNNLHLHNKKFIKGATHIGLQFGVVDFNFENLDYQVYLAEEKVLAKDFGANSLNLHTNAVATAEGTLLGVLVLRYYQEVNQELFAINADAALGIQVVGIGD